MKNINVNFGGFYCSKHEGLVDYMVNIYYRDKDYGDLEIDYKTIYNKYIIEYMDFFEEYLKDNYDLEIDFKNISLQSPRYYSYSTDKINAYISEKNSDLLVKEFKDRLEFKDWLHDATKLYSEDISFCSYGDIMSDKGGILIEFILDFILFTAYINGSWLKYYTVNNVYEIVYNINMPELLEAI